MSFFRPFETMKTSDYFGSFRSASIRIATMVRRGPFATDNWILCTTLVELQIFPFRENFLTVAFDRRYFLLLRPVPSLSLPSFVRFLALALGLGLGLGLEVRRF